MWWSKDLGSVERFTISQCLGAILSQILGLVCPYFHFGNRRNYIVNPLSGIKKIMNHKMLPELSCDLRWTERHWILLEEIVGIIPFWKSDKTIYQIIICLPYLWLFRRWRLFIVYQFSSFFSVFFTFWGSEKDNLINKSLLQVLWKRPKTLDNHSWSIFSVQKSILHGMFVLKAIYVMCT